MQFLDNLASNRRGWPGGPLQYYLTLDLAQLTLTQFLDTIFFFLLIPPWRWYRRCYNLDPWGRGIWFTILLVSHNRGTWFADVPNRGTWFATWLTPADFLLWGSMFESSSVTDDSMFNVRIRQKKNPIISEIELFVRRFSVFFLR